MITYLIQLFYFRKIRIAKNRLEVNPSMHQKANQYVQYAQELVKRSKTKAAMDMKKMNAPVYVFFFNLQRPFIINFWR